MKQQFIAVLKINRIQSLSTSSTVYTSLQDMLIKYKSINKCYFGALSSTCASHSVKLFAADNSCERTF